MRFAKIVFTIAGVWGLLVVTPLYFLVDVTGRQYPPPADYPQFFYGFLAVTIAWQLAFLVIGSNPVRFRLLMLPAIVEKLGYVTTLIVLYSQGRISATDANPILPDLVLDLLFIVAFAKTRSYENR